MILNKDQLQARAREFALTNALLIGKRATAGIRLSLQSDLNDLRTFANYLMQNRAQCIQPAEDWLLDHVAFIETQVQAVLRELPRKAVHQLPRLAGSKLPRIYRLCDDYLTHVDGAFEVHSFEGYLQSYQSVSVLKLAECAALPNVLRAVIVQRLADAMAQVRYRHEVCKSVAQLLKKTAARRLSDDEIRSVLEQEARKKSFGAAQVVHLVEHLGEMEPDIRVIRDWLAAYVENQSGSLEQLVSFEHQLQAELQVTCGSLVQSLHRLERWPWQLTFVKISHIEHVLSSDEALKYDQMDDASRSVLRERVALVARKLRVPETLVAQTSVELSANYRATMSTVEGVWPREAWLAYYLLNPHGLVRLRGALCHVARPRRLPELVVRCRPMTAYSSSGFGIFLGLLSLTVFLLSRGFGLGLGSLAVMTLLLLVPVSEWAVALLHSSIDRCLRPTPLLRYDFSTRVPDDARTMVVMPVIWSSLAEIDDVVDRLLVHFFANRQDGIHFGVLADFSDAPNAAEALDQTLISHAVSRIEALQKKYGADKFFLFHRRRSYNAADKIYMGWERKRGKIVEFIKLLTGSIDTNFTITCGDVCVLPNIRYLFTADHDTQLPIGVVGRMAGTMHLPYNAPRLNSHGTRVISGYGVLQPRIAVSLESTRVSRFSALWAGEPGIDPYAFAVSDPYQNLFDQAIFVGKGILDVRTFEKLLVSRIPENRVLSHDLLEGGFLRTGLTADIEVVESQPSTYCAYERRAHRWIRGDWQLIGWLGSQSRDAHGSMQRVDLGGITRWQMVDNLRRSLLSPVLLLITLLAVWTLPGSTAGWLAVVLLTLGLPFLRSLAHAIHRGIKPRSVGIGLLQSVVQVCTLPYAAALAIDAILRSLYRMLVSHRNLLEWMPAAYAERNGQHGRGAVGTSLFAYGRSGDVFILACLLLAVESSTVGHRVMAGAIVFLWLFARPLIRTLNQQRRRKDRAWLVGAKPELEQLAVQIWRFFEKYVTAKESWLPPDNVQYVHEERIAHRTSPTNIGLYFNCIMAAHDLKLIDTQTMVMRLKASLDTVKKLDKWNGHLFNWYDTQTAKPLSPRYVSAVDSGNLVAHFVALKQGLLAVRPGEAALQSEIQDLIGEIDVLIDQTDFSVLYNAEERLLCLGHHVDGNRRDSVLYDLLASEARQASFIAIAFGHIPVSHWNILGRTMTVVDGSKTLLSWSGTMFEYLMPSILMRTYDGTIWDSTYRGVVRKQQAYAKRHHVPFGISESGYYGFDYQLNYQYRAFGVPGLGFDRGLEQNLVVAPYATILALPVAGSKAVEALRELAEYGAKGPYGYYEAVDFTVSRLPRGDSHRVVRSFMAHHQAMSLLTLLNLIQDGVLVNRFHADLRIRCAALLLQERMPVKAALIREPVGVHAGLPEFCNARDDSERAFTEPTLQPEPAVFSNGNLTSVVTNNGNGFLLWNGLAVTRWREDSVIDTSGVLVYLRDVATEETFSVCPFPLAVAPTRAAFQLDKASFRTQVRDILVELEVTVAPHANVEIRRLRLENAGAEERTIEVTSFLELALCAPSADLAHPAFSKLFVQTMHSPEAKCLVAKRRPRDDKEHAVWAVHTLFTDSLEAFDYEFETDRAAFIGRGRTLENPRGALRRLSGSVGSVADPAFIMRRHVHLSNERPTHIYIVTGVAQTEPEALQLMHQFSEPAQVDRAIHLAWVRSQIDLRAHHLTPVQAAAAHELAGRLLYPAVLTNVRSRAIAQNTLGQSALWAHGVSGDNPLLTVLLQNLADLPFVLRLACQHQYLAKLGIQSDFLVLDLTEGGYQDELLRRLQDGLASYGIHEAKRVFCVKAAQLTDEERILFIAASRVLLRAGGPSLTAQLRVTADVQLRASKARHHLALPHSDRERNHHEHPSSESEFFNGYGGFIDDGSAYEIIVGPGKNPPKPWSNILANKAFGTLVTELGTGYSWWRNARECKLTPWRNDPVLDMPGECVYLRDIDTDEIWSAAPLPKGEGKTYRVVHGFGMTSIEQLNGGITHTLEMCVPLADSIKVSRLSLTNRTQSAKRVAVTYYAEWVLGESERTQTPFIITEWDEPSSTLCAHNRYQESFKEAVGFLHVAPEEPSKPGRLVNCSYTGDRTEFVGPARTLRHPAALESEQLSNRVGTSASSCGAIQFIVELPAGDSRSLLLLLGCAKSRQDALALVHKYKEPSEWLSFVNDVRRYWHKLTRQLQVKTPDRAMDILLNGWLVYQTLACRLWARTGFYQAGGAYGFRDQLQDSLALLHTDPDLTRGQILYHASHQYLEGDVQHWWHEETKKGIRTRVSDDLLWLPYAAAHYIRHTGDTAILDEIVAFLDSPELAPDEVERYEDTVISQEKGSLLEHCIRAIRRAMKFGEHGIPLIGSGDWNDGLNRVGVKGRGESVWLGWFLLYVLKQFVELLNAQLTAQAEVPPLSEQLAKAAAELMQDLNRFAWDGSWFRRTFTDDGHWFGTITNQECQIDAIAQSWSVIAQGTSPDRQFRAMRAFQRELVDPELEVVRLLAKAFDETSPSPGYIEGYPPGIRENGGQYTHGAAWSIIAWAMLHRPEEAHQLFRLLNPIYHAETSREVHRYGNEPYVMSADVYTAAPHQGQAGWSWYTGSAGWMYQAGVEHLLGVKRRGRRLYVAPCVPGDWGSFSIHYRYGRSSYHITVFCESSGKAQTRYVLDGKSADYSLAEFGRLVEFDRFVHDTEPYLYLVDDGHDHTVTVHVANVSD